MRRPWANGGCWKKTVDSISRMSNTVKLAVEYYVAIPCRVEFKNPGFLQNITVASTVFRNFSFQGNDFLIIKEVNTC
jgi:hypothetical protein